MKQLKHLKQTHLFLVLSGILEKKYHRQLQHTFYNFISISDFKSFLENYRDFYINFLKEIFTSDLSGIDFVIRTTLFCQQTLLIEDAKLG